MRQHQTVLKTASRSALLAILTSGLGCAGLSQHATSSPDVHSQDVGVSQTTTLPDTAQPHAGRPVPLSSLASQDAVSPQPTVGKVRAVAFQKPVIQQAETPLMVAPDPATVELAADFAPTSDLHSPTPLGSLRLEDLESIALSSHPALAEARGRISAACGQYVQAGLPFNPVLQYQAEEIGNEGAGGLHTLQLSQQMVTANKLGLAQQVAAHQTQRLRAELHRVELEVLTEVRRGFIRTLLAQQRAEITQQIVVLSENSVASVQALLDAQEVSKVALLQAEVESQQARISAENALANLDANRRALSAAVGGDLLSDGPLDGNPAAGLDDTPWDELLATVAAASPELSAAGSTLQRARWALHLACAQVTPNVTGQLGVGVDTATDDTFATVGISIPLPIRNRNQGNIHSARASVASASAAMQRIELDLASRLAGAVGRYQTALQRYRRLQGNVLPNAEETFELSGKAFAAGETGYLQLLTAQRTLFSTRLSVLDALVSARETHIEIEGLLVTLR